MTGWVVSVLTVGVLGDINADVIDCRMVWLQRSTRERGMRRLQGCVVEVCVVEGCKDQ